MRTPAERKKHKARLKKQKNNKSGSGGWDDPKADFEPLSPSYDTNRDFNKALGQRTKGQWKPQVNTLRREFSKERRLSRASRKQSRRSSSWLSRQYDKNADMVSKSMKAIMGNRDDSMDSAQQNLLAGLNDTQGADAQMAQLRGSTGGPDTTDQMGSVIAAGQSGASSGKMINNSMGAQAIQSRQMVKAPKLQGVQERAAENKTLHAKLQGISEEKKQILMSIPQIREQVRKEMIDEEIAKASELARERIASKSVKLDWAKLREAGRQADQQNSQFYAGLGLDTKKFNLAKKQLKLDIGNATNASQKEAATNKAKAFQTATEAAASWLKAQGYDKNKKKANPEGLFRLLKGYGGSSQALKIMTMYGGPMARWAKGQRSGGSDNFTFGW